MPSSNKKMSVKKAALINGSGKYVNILLSLVVTSILSRILSPEEYGVVSVVTIFTTFFSIFSDMGFGSAYIEEKSLSKKDRDYLFSFICYVGIILFAVFFGFAYFVVWFYNSEKYLHVCWLLGLNLFFTAADSIPLSELQKENKFFTVSLVQIISSIISYGIAIWLAYNNGSYYSIVFESISYSFINFIVFEVITKCKEKDKLKCC